MLEHAAVAGVLDRAGGCLELGDDRFDLAALWSLFDSVSAAVASSMWNWDGLFLDGGGRMVAKVNPLAVYWR
jgi:hypothetical protein